MIFSDPQAPNGPRTWSFTRISNNNNSPRRDQYQSAKYKNVDERIKFNIDYHKNTRSGIYEAGNIHLENLYHEKEKPERGIPARAIVSALKRMTPMGKKFYLTNASFIPVGPNKRIPRTILSKNYNLYPGLTPTAEELSVLKGIRKITAAILGNKSLSDEEVKTLLHTDYVKFAPTLAKATGKKYTLSELYNLMRGVRGVQGILVWSNIHFRRAFTKENKNNKNKNKNKNKHNQR